MTNKYVSVDVLNMTFPMVYPGSRDPYMLNPVRYTTSNCISFIGFLFTCTLFISLILLK